MVFPSVAGALAVVNGLTPQAVSNTTPVNGTGIDTSLYEGTMLAVLNSAAASASDTLAITVEESDSLSTGYTAIPADALFNPANGANATFANVTDAGASFQVLGLRKERLKRYIRFVATAAGSSISITFSVILVAPKKYA
jgi:hypothetical protein